MNPSRFTRAEIPVEKTGTRSGVRRAHPNVGSSPLDHATPASKHGASSSGAYGNSISPSSLVPRSGMRSSKFATAMREPKRRPYSGHGSVLVGWHSLTSKESDE